MPAAGPVSSMVNAWQMSQPDQTAALQRSLNNYYGQPSATTGAGVQGPSPRNMTAAQAQNPYQYILNNNISIPQQLQPLMSSILPMFENNLSAAATYAERYPNTPTSRAISEFLQYWPQIRGQFGATGNYTQPAIKYDTNYGFKQLQNPVGTDEAQNKWYGEPPNLQNVIAWDTAAGAPQNIGQDLFRTAPG